MVAINLLTAHAAHHPRTHTATTHAGGHTTVTVDDHHGVVSRPAAGSEPRTRTVAAGERPAGHRLYAGMADER